jgi:uncharacterized membrane protein YdfJ with MMPL/SSD domain
VPRRPAADVLVVVFGSFIGESDRVLRLFGLGLSVAVLIDATIERVLLVPATMELLGDRNWWIPRWLNRIPPKVHIEAPPDLDAELAQLEAAEPERQQAASVRTVSYPPRYSTDPAGFDGPAVKHGLSRAHLVASIASDTA